MSDTPIPGTAITTNIATHKLTVKLEDQGQFTNFYLTEQEADWISKTINGPEQFIVLPKAVDPDAPSFYPKRGAWLERMDPRERERQMKEKAIRQADAEREEREAEERKALSIATNQWIKEHPKQYEDVARIVRAHRHARRSGFSLPRMSVSTEQSMERYAIWGHVFNALKKGADPFAEADALLDTSAPVA